MCVQVRERVRVCVRVRVLFRIKPSPWFPTKALSLHPPAPTTPHIHSSSTVIQTNHLLLSLPTSLPLSLQFPSPFLVSLCT